MVCDTLWVVPNQNLNPRFAKAILDELYERWDRTKNNCRSYARQSVDDPPSGDGSYENNDNCFPLGP